MILGDAVWRFSVRLNWLGKSFFLLVSILIVTGRDSATPDRERAAASVLFERFETVLYSKSDLLSAPQAYHQMSAQDTNYLRFPFAYLSKGLDSAGKQISAEMLESAIAVLVGARDFQPPKGLGGVRSQRCYVVILGDHNAFQLQKYFHQAPQTSAAGSHVWKWSAKLGEFGEGDTKPSSLYTTQIGHSYVLVSNDLSELQTVADRLSSSNQDAPVLAGIREWESVRHHEIWGYRHYRHSGVADPVAAGMSDVTPAAESLIFFVDVDKKVGVLRLLASDNSTADKINSAITSARSAFPPLKTSGGGASETMIPFAGDEATSERVFMVMGLFGFGIYL
jgi:hypothetical protein